MILVVFLSSGVFEIAEATGVQQGTKIVLHLKDDCKEFSTEDRVKGITAGAASATAAITHISSYADKLLFRFQRL